MANRKGKQSFLTPHGYTAVDKYAVAIEELDFIAVNCGEEEEDSFWLAQLREDVTNLHRHHHLIKCTWLEKKPDGAENAYVPGTDDTVLAGSIICRVKLKDITETGPQMVLGLSQKQKDRILRKLAEQTQALESGAADDGRDMSMMLDSDQEARKASREEDEEDDEAFGTGDDSDAEIFYDDDQEWRASTTGRVASNRPRKRRKVKRKPSAGQAVGQAPPPNNLQALATAVAPAANAPVAVANAVGVAGVGVAGVPGVGVAGVPGVGVAGVPGVGVAGVPGVGVAGSVVEGREVA